MPHFKANGHSRSPAGMFEALLTPPAHGPQRKEGRLLSVLILGLISANWSLWVCFRWKRQEFLQVRIHRSPRLGESEPTCLAPSSAQPLLLKMAVSSHHVFSWETSPWLTRKPIWGEERVFAPCDTQDLCPDHARWQLKSRKLWQTRCFTHHFYFRKLLRMLGKLLVCYSFTILIFT